MVAEAFCIVLFIPTPQGEPSAECELYGSRRVGNGRDPNRHCLGLYIAVLVDLNEPRRIKENGH